MKPLRLLFALLIASALVSTFTFAQIKVTGGDTGTFGGASKIEPGMFGSPEFLIVLTTGKNGKIVVGGRVPRGRGMVSVTGNLTATNKILARLQDGPQTPVDGRYNPNNDTIIITRIGSESMNEVLTRSSSIVKTPTYPIEPGQYSGRSVDPDGEWEVMVSKSASGAFNVIGHITINGKTTPIKAILRKDGSLAGYGQDEGQTVDGKYDIFTKHIEIKIRGGGLRATAFLSPGPLPRISVFGLVSKEIGNVPGPGGNHEHTVQGGISEDSFFIDMKRIPESDGWTKITHHYSTTMGSTLAPGQIIELKCWSEAEKGGKFPPNIGSGAQWIVEGDVKELEHTKTFAGIASDGKFYPRSEGVTKFRVGGSGTIRIIASQGGQLWGGSTNWNPCTYTYKFREPVKASVGGG